MAEVEAYDIPLTEEIDLLTQCSDQILKIRLAAQRLKGAGKLGNPLKDLRRLMADVDLRAEPVEVDDEEADREQDDPEGLSDEILSRAAVGDGDRPAHGPA